MCKGGDFSFLRCLLCRLCGLFSMFFFLVFTGAVSITRYFCYYELLNNSRIRDLIKWGGVNECDLLIHRLFARCAWLLRRILIFVAGDGQDKGRCLFLNFLFTFFLDECRFFPFGSCRRNKFFTRRCFLPTFDCFRIVILVVNCFRVSWVRRLRRVVLPITYKGVSSYNVYFRFIVAFIGRFLIY